MQMASKIAVIKPRISRKVRKDGYAKKLRILLDEYTNVLIVTVTTTSHSTRTHTHTLTHQGTQYTLTFT